MIYIKLLGGALLLFAGGFSAHTAARYQRFRLSVLDGWIDLIFHIRGQIDCYLMPLDDILACADPDILKACMCKSPHPDLPMLLRASTPYLSKETHRLIGAFIRELGGSYREEQLRRCDFYIQALRDVRDKLGAELPARIKLSVTLSMCSALAAAILLW